MGSFRRLYALAVIVIGCAPAALSAQADRTESRDAPSQIEQLRSEIDALQTEVGLLREAAGRPATDIQETTMEQRIDTLRMALVVMGVGLAGGLVRLRQLSKTTSTLQNKD
jgi:hypothetical protein